MTWQLTFTERSTVSSDATAGPTVSFGIAGPRGPAGPSGGSQQYPQSSPAATWTIQHNLNRYPLVSVVVAGELVDADIEYSDLNTVAVVFASPVAGVATLI